MVLIFIPLILGFDLDLIDVEEEYEQKSLLSFVPSILYLDLDIDEE